VLTDIIASFDALVGEKKARRDAAPK